jgi:hypothetical protein
LLEITLENHFFFQNFPDFLVEKKAKILSPKKKTLLWAVLEQFLINAQSTFECSLATRPLESPLENWNQKKIKEC